MRINKLSEFEAEEALVPHAADSFDTDNSLDKTEGSKHARVNYRKFCELSGNLLSRDTQRGSRNRNEGNKRYR